MTLAIGVRAADQESIVLGLGEWRVTADPAATLVCLGLGSCVALCARDPLNKIGGMVHMVLPDSGEGRVQGNGAKFVDLAVPMLRAELLAAGANRKRLSVDLVGGASMLKGMAFTDAMNVGARNIAAAHRAVAAAGLRLRSDETGGNHGRTVRLSVGTGELEISTAGGADGRVTVSVGGRDAGRKRG